MGMKHGNAAELTTAIAAGCASNQRNRATPSRRAVARAAKVIASHDAIAIPETATPPITKYPSDISSN
jgi:hypothetical protein